MVNFLCSRFTREIWEFKPLKFGHLKLEFSKPLGAEGNPRELLILKPKTMKKTRFTEAQIVNVHKQHEAGSKVIDLCRELSISDATFYNWKAKYGGMEVNDVKP